MTEAAGDARRALTLAREAAYPGGEAQALTVLCYVAHNTDARADAFGLFISVRTVSSHLDRIGAKTGYRRRADITRLALSEGLV